jgi:hypothetical protein
MAEADLMRHLQKRASELGARLFRQNSGVAWVGRIIEHTRTRIVLENPRPFHAGVPGMADLGGWITVEITPDMVGRRIAVYAAVEVKTERGRTRREQAAFLKAVSDAGGRAGVAREDGDLTHILGV